MSNQSSGQPLTQQVARLQDDLTKLVRVLVEGLNQQLSPYDVDAVEYTVLSACVAAGPISIRDLKELVPIDPGHLSRAATQLQRKGLVQKMRLMDDQRLVRLRVTEEGLSVVPDLMRHSQEYYALVVRRISQERLAGSIAVMESMITGADSPGANGSARESVSGIAAQTQGESIESLIGRLQGDMTLLINVLFTGIQERVSSNGFGVAEYSVFATCYANESITISGLAELVPVDVGRISRMVSKLEDRELVQKVRLEGNRRVVRVKMTDKGRTLALELMGSVGEHYANVASRVSEQELTNLADFMERMTKNASEAIASGETSA